MEINLKGLYLKHGAVYQNYGNVSDSFIFRDKIDNKFEWGFVFDCEICK